MEKLNDMVGIRARESNAKPKSRRKILVFIFAIALLYSPKYIVRQINHLRPDPYVGFLKLNGVQVPDGPYIKIEKDFPKLDFVPIDLGRAHPISSDMKGNLILFIDKETPPSDFPEISRTGQYLRSSDGKYLDIGDKAAQLTIDGELVQVTDDQNLLVGGNAIQPSPIRGFYSEENMPALFAAANGAFLNMHFEDPSNKVTGFTSSGKHIRVTEKISPAEPIVVSLLREIGVFESATGSVSQRSLQATANGTIYGQTWSIRGKYADPFGWTGRLCILSGDHFKIVPELKDININTEMLVTSAGKVGLNIVGNCSFLTRPMVYEHGKITLLPIPEGSISADLIGLANDGSAILQAKHDTAWLFYQNGKLFPLKHLLEDGPFGKLAPFGYGNSNRKLLPEQLTGFRVQNPILSSGDILCQSELEHLVLLRKNKIVI